MGNERVGEMLEATLAELKAALTRHLPESTYRDFALWALSEAMPTHERDMWIQGLGAVQMAMLTVGLCQGIVTDERDWPDLARLCAPLNVYLIYEAMSDDLAIGLATHAVGDATFELRRNTLHSFNRLMIEQLTGSDSTSIQVLGSLFPAAQHISGIEQKLNPDKHRVIADSYLLDHPQVTSDDLEFTVGPCLQMNMAAANNLVQQTSGFQAGALFKQGLIRRYAGVNSVLEDVVLPANQLADVGADTILVFPTLAYYIIMWAEILHPMDLYPILENGTLQSALHDAALLSRLLNDLGSLAVLPPEDLQAVIDTLAAQAARDEAVGQTLGELLEENMTRYGPILARLHKDIVHGEYNLCLNGLMGGMPIQSSVNSFGQRVIEYSALYRLAACRLEVSLKQITDTLGDGAVSHLIRKFVSFHQVLYSNPHTELRGEYTV